MEPGGHTTSRCRSCGAEIIWALTVNGIPMPVDASPTADGNCVLTPAPGGRVTVEVLGPLDLALAGDDHPPLRMAHHATCPDADTWRRR